MPSTRPINPPQIVHPDRDGLGHLPSWPGCAGFLNAEHAGIFEATKDLPGWQDPPDSQKLYEMGYRSGGIILEIGVFGGRSAVVEVRGALAGARERGEPPPQYYGVDVDPGAFARSFKTIDDAGVAEHCLLFHGDLARFLREIPIVPTMVFVDGDHRYPGCWADLRILSEALAPGTPVMCHDYGGIPGVRRAVDEWIATGRYESMGRFAGSILLRVAAKVGEMRAGEGRGLAPKTFASVRAALRDRYLGRTTPSIRMDRMYTPARDLTRAAREDLLGPTIRRTASNRGRWPYAKPDSEPLPPTLPGGAPWPKITVVTPSFNQGRYIEETILSVRNQGYPNLEHIIMDGGSTDQTMAIVERYRDGFAKVISEKDEGQSDAINKGMALATGDIVTWLNSDDMLAPGALAAAALGFHLSGADMVAGECHIYRDGVLIQKHLTACEDGPLPLHDLLDTDGKWLEGQFFYQPEVMFTKAIWEQAGGHVRTDLYHSMDYELWTRMAHAGARLHVIGRPIAHFRAHPEQKTAGSVVGGFRVELPKARDAVVRRLGLNWTPPPKREIRQSLRVVLYNDLGYLYGAGIAHRRLAEALLTAGHQVFAAAAASTEHHDSAPRSTHADTLARIASFRPDLVVCGNLHGADVDAGILGLIAARFPTAFVLHDMWLLTGRCAYTGGCRQYLTGCGDACACDKNHPKLSPELVTPAWETKRRVINSSVDLFLWANSDWALGRVREALKGALAARPQPQTIKFGFELDVFRPREKRECRDRLGLPLDKFIVMSSASSLDDPRKGLAHLAQAMGLLKLDESLVVCPGWFAPGQPPPIPGMRAMGYMKDPRQLAMLYAAADLFVGPSLEEAFGQVFIEAAACGTPSVGYPVGGKPEAILDGVSGRLTDYVTPASLADAIEELYCDPELRRNMGRWGRLWAENQWSMSASAHRLHTVLRRQGLADRLRLTPKLNLELSTKAPPEPITVAATLPAWRAGAGFDHWEGPYPERGLARCRWALGPVAKFELEPARSGPGRILISGRTFEAGQRVRLVRVLPSGERQAVGEADVPADHQSKTDRVLAFRTDLRDGPNHFELHFWKWQTGPRPLALLVTWITAVPDSAPRPAVKLNVHANGRAPGAAIEVKPEPALRR